MRHWQVYVMTSEAGAVKVGVSKSPERRAAGVSTQGFGDAALAFATEVGYALAEMSDV